MNKISVELSYEGRKDEVDDTIGRWVRLLNQEVKVGGRNEEMMVGDAPGTFWDRMLRHYNAECGNNTIKK